jgi:hypothetical protein
MNSLAMPPARRSINFLDMMGGDQGAEEINESNESEIEDIQADVIEEDLL